ncbi:MAG: hypothetical protein H6661_02530 [Ardenticatenaceae bacterium]|nr:hypothetical protein [Ardenticatenaceae bacterium]
MARWTFLLLFMGLAACQMQMTAVATPTAVLPTSTSSLDPATETPMLMCTPPACAANETYFCSGDCPGGCGTTCATVTPGSAPRDPGVPADLSTAPAGWEELESWLTCRLAAKR